MKINRGKFYLSDLATASYAQRLFYVVANDLRPDWRALSPNFNPLDWCVRDICKVLYLAVLFSLAYPFLLLPAALYVAHKMRVTYSDIKWAGVYVARAYWLDVQR